VKNQRQMQTSAPAGEQLEEVGKRGLEAEAQVELGSFGIEKERAIVPKVPLDIA
jgi:hypothetical protein